MKKHDQEDHLKQPCSMGWRHVQAFLMFLGMASGYAHRACMSVAIVAMTDKQSANPNFTEYRWDQYTNSLILSSFFWGYVLTQVPASYLAHVWSAQKLVALGIFLSSILTMLVPYLATFGPWAVIGCRVAIGLSQGCLLPCVQTLLSRWAPTMERARLGSFIMNGPQFGTVITMPISGYLAKSAWGWNSIFYIFGMVGCAWSVLFFFVAADHPSDHPRISPREAYYINSSLGSVDKGCSVEKPKTPWKAILTSVPMWALITVHCGHNWGYYTLLTQLPNYMKSVLGYDISQSGVVSSLPYLAMWLMGFPLSYISDWSLRRGASTVLVRKIINSIGIWIPALALLALCLIGPSDKAVLIGIFIVAVGANAGVSCGFQINHIDLSPNFAGQMMSVTNGIANVLGILAPYISGVIVSEPTNEDQWRIVFYITAVTYFFTNLVFVIFGKADLQPWDGPRDVDVPNRRPGRVSVISIASDPAMVSMVQRIKETEEKVSRC